MAFDPELHAEVLLAKHLMGMHDQDKHAEKQKENKTGFFGGGFLGGNVPANSPKKPSAPEKPKKPSKTKEMLEDIGFKDDGELSLAEGTALAAAAGLVGIIGFKAGVHRDIKFATKGGDRMWTAHSPKDFKGVDEATYATMLGENLNGMGAHTQRYHPGNSFWSAAGDASGSSAQIGAAEDMRTTVNRWTSGRHGDINRTVLDPLSNRPRAGDSEFLQAVSTSAIPEEVGDLHRGMNLSGEIRLSNGKKIEIDKGQLVAGAELDLLPESYSAKKTVAGTFSSGFFGMGASTSGDPTIFTVKGGLPRTGLNVDPVATAAFRFEDEWVLGGKFKVVEVRENVRVGVHKVRRQVIVEQVSPPDFDYARHKNVTDQWEPARKSASKMLASDTTGIFPPTGMTMGDVRSQYGIDKKLSAVITNKQGVSETVEMTPLEIGHAAREIKYGRAGQQVTSSPTLAEIVSELYESGA